MSIKTTQQRGVLETKLTNNGYKVIGIDEVGRGCLAGPVVAACVMLDYTKLHSLPPKKKTLIRDSKKLSQQQRLSIIQTIQHISEAYETAFADEREIEHLGIVDATFTAMRRALQKMPCWSKTFILVDGRQPIPQIKYEQSAVVKGDSLVYAIAAASIIAKVSRDLFMQKAAILYPDYGFDQHVGYGTQQHLNQIKKLGPCPLHRKNFAPIRKWVTLKSPDT